MSQKNFIQFSINGQLHTVSGEQASGGAKLVDFIRDEAGLKGTKYLCRQGGCGACVVSVTHTHPVSRLPTTKSLNSCLTPLLSCDGWDVSTVEDLGDRQKGYDPIQRRLAQFAGTQCGFCTPGMIMTFKALLDAKGGAEKLRMEDVEGALDGNICRCTGYRPILDAFKSFASDAPPALRQKVVDIEDCLQCPCPTNPSAREKCCRQPPLPSASSVVPISGGRTWLKVHALPTLYDSLQQSSKQGTHVRLVAGNTGIGIFGEEAEDSSSPQLFVDISSIPELLRASYNSHEIVLGAGLSISDAIATLAAAATFHADFAYAKTIATHFQSRLGNIHVRNGGTLGGNVSLKVAHPEFASDIWLLFEAVGAKVTVGCSASHNSRQFTMAELAERDLRGKVILSFHLPSLHADFHLKSFKVSPRYQNSKGYVNAAFLLRVLPSQNFRLLQKPTLLFGGLGPNFRQAAETEEFLNGKSLRDPATLQGALDILEKEAQVPPPKNGLAGSAEYRTALAKSLLYKAILSVVGKDAAPSVALGGVALTRGPRSGAQSYVKDKASQEVLYAGFPKLEAVVQCSGEAEYTNDVPKAPGELFGAFVLSSLANATLKHVDTSSAMAVPGVVRFIGASDIPGGNNYMIWAPTPEPIFVSSKVEHAGQPIGLLLATSRAAAFLAASKVHVTYGDIQKPILTIDDSLAAAKKEGREAELQVRVSKSAKEGGSGGISIQGEFRVGAQHHFQMEPHSTLCVPTEDGLKVYSATQWIDKTQAAISHALSIPVNNIQMQVRRLGGGFGGKATRSGQTATACAVAAHVTNKPVRVTLDLETHMRMTGKKLPYFIKYDVNVDPNGKIRRLNADVFCDPGFSPNEETTYLFAMNIQNCYDADEGWNVRMGRTLTNTPANTYCRLPGHLQGSATIEVIMEHIAFSLAKDPWEVRMANMMGEGSAILAAPPGTSLATPNPLVSLIHHFKKETQFESRSAQVDAFNKGNLWVKRGLGLVPIRFPNHFIGGKYEVWVGIHHIDGSVVVSHGGVEMGQGINTKVAQTVASFLRIPINKIKLRPTTNCPTPNSSLTAAGTTSESCCFAAAEACRILRERMEPVKTSLPGDASWETLVAECHKKSVDLTASFMNESGKDGVKGYDVNILCLTEVEVDVLTGEYVVVRLDCSIDGTRSLNPEVDLGQVEGGLVFGLGLWTTERLEYDVTSGQLLTANAWDYKPPMSKDIPADFRVTLYSDTTPNKDGVLGSKGPGEPSGCAAVAVLFALRNAIAAARRDVGNQEWFQLNGPVTPEDVFRASLTSHTRFHL